MKNVINRAIMAKKKFIFTLMLAIAGSVCMMKAACIPAGIAAMDPITIIQISGTIQWLGYPCEENEDCPPCLTPAIVTSDKTYYLSTSNPEMQEFLEHMESTPVPSMYLLPLQATASGIPYTRGSYDFLTVNNIYDLYVQYFSDQLPRINSLCDEWHVLHEPFECMGPYCYLETDIYRLTRDTGISIFIDIPVKYFKLEKNGQYIGALHEGNNRDIYYVPANSQNAYLLYAFNAQVGDVLENVWLGGETEKEDCINAQNATVIAISDSNPRIFTLEIIPYTPQDGMEVYPYRMNWIEGVGMSDGPVGAHDSNKLCIEPADLGVYTLLCAYKNGNQLYSSSKAQKYGCEFNGYYVEEHTTDTIPVYSYTGDDPGSSTVDPVDPNQVVVTLKGDILTVKETSGDVITYSVQKETSNNAPKRMQTLFANTFQNSVSIELTEEGLYQLNLSNPLWDYRIYGIFNYPQRHDAIDTTMAPTPAAQKIIRNGQLLIRKGEKVYTLQGSEVKE